MPLWRPTQSDIATAAGNNDGDVRFAVTAGGKAVVVYSALDEATGMRRIYAVTRRPGHAWSYPVPVSPQGVPANDPMIAADDHGAVYVAWNGVAAGGHKRVQAATKPAKGSWSDPVWVSDAGADAYIGDLGARAGVVAYVWQTYDGFSQRARARVRRADGTWTKRRYLSATAPWNAGSMNAVVDQTGRVYAIWSESTSDEPYRIKLRKMPSGGSWTSAKRISRPGVTSMAPRAVVGTGGDVLAAWHEYHEAGSYRVVAWRHLFDGGTTRAVVSPDGQDSQWPHPAVSPAGDALVLYVKDDNQAESVFRAADGAWQAPQAVSLIAPTRVNARDAAFLRDGDATAVWSSYNASGGTRIYRAATRDAGSGTWGGVVTLEGPSTDLHGAGIDVDDEGNAYIVTARVTGGDTIFNAHLGDAYGPTTRMDPLASRTLEMTTYVDWSSTDRISGIYDYDLRSKAIAWNVGAGKWSILLDGTTSHHIPVAFYVGATHCFGARATDTISWTGPWSNRRCITTPADDRAAVNHGFANRQSDAFYQGTFRRSKTDGDRLVFQHAVGKSFFLVAAKGPGNGTVVVKWKGHRVAVVSLAAAKNKRQKVIPLFELNRRLSGNLVLKVKGTGNPVRIDGLIVVK
jgi:hypothetical protein